MRALSLSDYEIGIAGAGGETPAKRATEQEAAVRRSESPGRHWHCTGPAAWFWGHCQNRRPGALRLPRVTYYTITA